MKVAGVELVNIVLVIDGERRWQRACWWMLS